MAQTGNNKDNSIIIYGNEYPLTTIHDIARNTPYTRVLYRLYILIKSCIYSSYWSLPESYEYSRDSILSLLFQVIFSGV